MRPGRYDGSPLAAIESALRPGDDIGDLGVDLFVEPLEQVRARVLETPPTEAVDLFAAFVAGCLHKADEVDDEAGEFGRFTRQLVCDWIRARQAVGGSEATTARTIVGWMDRDRDAYFLLSGLETDAVQALDEAGADAFEEVVGEGQRSAKPGTHERRYRIEVLKAIHRARKRGNAYEALCEDEGGATSSDCAVLAELSLQGGRAEEALAWTERGLALEGEGSQLAWGLPGLKRKALLALGRSGEVLAETFAEYCSHPCGFYYQRFMEHVPEGERETWRAQALEALAGAEPAKQIEVLSVMDEVGRLAALVETLPRRALIDLGHVLAGRASACLLGEHPLLAARLQVGMCLRVLASGKSRYYGEALGNLETARDLLLAHDRKAEWEAVVAEIQGDHARKSSFMRGFKRLLATGSAAVPSFLEVARRQWCADPEA